MPGVCRKAAQISAFPQFSNVEPFAQLRWKELKAWAPSTLVGYRLDLTRLSEQLERAGDRLESLDRAVFVLTDCGSYLLSDENRASLWKSFGVPVYELLLAPGYRLLAAECEAHDGWHLSEGLTVYEKRGELVYQAPPADYAHTGLSGTVETAACHCGRKTNRLKDLRPHLPQPHQRTISAIA